jgi:hypothetical protein
MKNVIVTGASSGIGRELVRLLCNEDFRVLGIGRDANAFYSLKGLLGNCFNYLVQDLASSDAIENIVEVVSNDYTPLHLLINNAGYGLGKKLLEHDQRELEEIFLVNAIRPIELTVKLIDYMDEEATVVFVLTAGIHVMMSSLASYGAAKAALHYMVKTLDKELSSRGINVIRVYPGAVRTKFFERAGIPLKGSAMSPQRVAVGILKAIKKRRHSVYIPWYLKILQMFNYWPLPLEV